MLQDLGTGEVKSDIETLLAQAAAGAGADPDVRRAADAALSSIRGRERMISAAGHVIYGLSLASVFLFAALGLAITFGVMGVINMAHGEMLTIGAYSAFVVQAFFQRHAPGALWAYPLVAIPVAFLVAGAMGVLLERSVIRWLYGRPLETLLATWGISLGAHPDHPPALRGQQRGRREPRLAGGRLRDLSRPRAPLQPARRWCCS